MSDRGATFTPGYTLLRSRRHLTMQKKTSLLLSVTIILFVMGFFCMGMSLPRQPVTVMSYNIHHGKDLEGNDQIGAMADFIRASGAGIVGLQEVDSVCIRSGRVDQTAELARKTGMYPVFARHFAFQGGAYGQALLSKYPVHAVETSRLPVASGTVVMLMADLLITDTQKIRVVNVHLDYRGQESREQQVRLIVERLKTCELPIVFVGDLNTVPGSPELATLMRGLRLVDTHSDGGYTFPANQPDRRIDFILTDPGVKVIRTDVPNVPYSDHLPIVSELMMSGK